MEIELTLCLLRKLSIAVSTAFTTRTASPGSEPETAACLAAVSDSTCTVNSCGGEL